MSFSVEGYIAISTRSSKSTEAAGPEGPTGAGTPPRLLASAKAEL